MIFHLALSHLTDALSQGNNFNPAPAPPDGADKVEGLVANVKWLARMALVFGFFLGLAVFAGGRLGNHHRAGQVGAGIILASLGGAILYSVGPTMIAGFSK